jgi:hypothetical protein
MRGSRDACDAADRATQVFGGRESLEAVRVGRRLRDTRVAPLDDGTDEMWTLKVPVDHRLLARQVRLCRLHGQEDGGEGDENHADHVECDRPGLTAGPDQ